MLKAEIQFDQFSGKENKQFDHFFSDIPDIKKKLLKVANYVLSEQQSQTE